MTANRLSYLIVVALLAVLAFYGFSRPGWEGQLNRTAVALRSARSWESVVTINKEDGSWTRISEQVNCPVNSHALAENFLPGGQSNQSYPMEAWTIDGQAFIKTPAQFTPTTKIQTVPGCGELKFLELPPLPSISMLLSYGHAERKGKSMVGNVPCRIWTIQVPAGDGWADLYDLCIDSSDFPLELKTKDGKIVAQAKHWNEALKIDPPELRAQTESK